MAGTGRDAGVRTACYGGADGCQRRVLEELRSARERIAELQRRAGAGPGLPPEALAELDVAIEELSVTGQELRSQTVEPICDRQGGLAGLRWLLRAPEAEPVAGQPQDLDRRLGAGGASR